MGLQRSINVDMFFPKQSAELHKRVWVAFHFNYKVEGEVVRDDVQDPFLTIIKLKDGRFVLGSECSYTFMMEEENLSRKDKAFVLTATTVGGLVTLIGLLIHHHWLAGIVLAAGWALLTYAVVTNRPRGNWPFKN